MITASMVLTSMTHDYAEVTMVEYGILGKL